MEFNEIEHKTSNGKEVIMLTVQVNYLSVAELERHNKAAEQETTRHNQREEKLGFDSLAETSRHNLATETETNRHNLVTERQTWASIWNQGRQIEVQNRSVSVQERNVAETERANRAREALQQQANWIQAGGLTETIRTHRANEAIGMFNAQTERSRLDLARQQFEVQSAQGWQSLANQRFANETNRMNAFTNARNAATNERNADTNRINAYTNIADTISNAAHRRRSDNLNAFNSLVDLVPLTW